MQKIKIVDYSLLHRNILTMHMPKGALMGNTLGILNSCLPPNKQFYNKKKVCLLFPRSNKYFLLCFQNMKTRNSTVFTSL